MAIGRLQTEQDLANFIRQTLGLPPNLQASLALKPTGTEALRIVRGVVDASANILAGTGFTVAHTGTGVYTVTFTTAFDTVPAVVPSVSTASTSVTFSTSSAAVGSVIVRVFSAGVAADAQFHFIAVG
jgi:hypothetical protein